MAQHPVQGQLLVDIYDPRGAPRQLCVVAKPEGVSEDSYQLFGATLPLAHNGVGVCYRLGYRTADGQERIGQRQRRLAICDEAPRRIADLPWVWLGSWAHQPVYGPPPQVSMTPVPSDWDGRLFYSILLDRFACTESEDRRNLGLTQVDLLSPFAAHGGSLVGLIEKLDYLVELGVGAVVISPVYVNDTEGYHGYHPVHLLMVDAAPGNLGATSRTRTPSTCPADSYRS
uniref:Alpha amylase, catalytic domain n=1 Tax=Candidatus Kentrum sp. LPFa TaxID=2126335 RepID=A0A450WS52_9GAMM|nr:MAG: Alpha amylase, catalytic domain [Candidatus Kentron sp. LPFa]